MKALLINGPHEASVQDVAEPFAAPGEVVVDVQRAGVCGTDFEFFSGSMAYLHSGHAEYPIRIGHEWMGTVSGIGEGVDSAWVGKRVTGDTMLGCGSCRRCLNGLQHVCDFRTELGIRGGRPGALAEKVAVPANSVLHLPESVGDGAGAMVEPGGNAYRAVQAAGLRSGDRCLIAGPGTIGLLCAMFARAAGAEVHLLGRGERSLAFARTLGFDNAWSEESLPQGLPWDAAIDASNAAHLPAKVLDLVEPGRRVAYVGLAGSRSLIDTRELVLRDLTAVGVLSASPGLSGTIEAYASVEVDPRPLIAATVSLEALPDILAGNRPAQAGPGPKFHVAI
jgi:threonine dehydrogenase-like Zn-dependent dehydrogenase